MKQRIFSIFFALVLVCSFGLVTAAPAGAFPLAQIHMVTGDGAGGFTLAEMDQQFSTETVDASAGNTTLSGWVTLGNFEAGNGNDVWYEAGLVSDETYLGYSRLHNKGVYMIALRTTGYYKVHVQNVAGQTPDNVGVDNYLGDGDGYNDLWGDAALSYFKVPQAAFDYELKYHDVTATGGRVDLRISTDGETWSGWKLYQYTEDDMESFYGWTHEDAVASGYATDDDLTDARIVSQIFVCSTTTETFTADYDNIQVNDVSYVLAPRVLNVDTNKGYTSIQLAIDDASANETITVAAGTYAGAVVNEDLTIIGAVGGGSVITSGVPYKGGSSLLTGFRLDDGADGAEIRNFTMNGNYNTAGQFWFAVFARNADSVIVDSLALDDMVQGITNWGGSGWEITKNVIGDTYPTTGGGIAIYLGADPTNFPHCDNNLVQGNTLSTTAVQKGTFTGAAIALWFDMRGKEVTVLEGDESMTGNQIIGNPITASGLENQVGIEIGVGGLEGDADKVAACLGVIHDNTVQNNTIDNAEWGLYLYVTTNLTVSGNTIKNCSDCGIYMKDDHANCLINNNNIYGNTNYGLNNTDGDTYDTTVDATNNWWDDASGPYHAATNPAGMGDAVSDDVDYDPWFGAGVEDSKSEETGTGEVTVDAKTEADTEVVKTGAGTPTITVTEYTDNPGDGAPGGFSSVGKYIDVHLDDTTGVVEIEIRNYYTLDDIGTLDETTLRLSWWNGSDWVVCSDSGVNPVDTNGYSGYIWAKIRAPSAIPPTIPTLADLAGTPFMPIGKPPKPAPPPAPPAGGGGPPPVYYIRTNLFDIEERYRISSQGKILEIIEAISEDGMLPISIPKGTIALDKDGRRLKSLWVLVDETPPPPPEGGHIIGLAYDFEPDGATFDPLIELLIHYDPKELPENISSIFVAYYDKQQQSWIQLEPISGFVAVVGTVTAEVSHFTTFAIIAAVTPPPPPAVFSVSNLTVRPLEVQPKEAVTITVSVANTGGSEGSYSVVLRINGAVEATKEVTLEAGAREEVTFTIPRDVAGSYSVDVNGLSGLFAVKEKLVPAPPPPAPPAPPVAPPAPPPRVNWAILGPIIGVVVFLAIFLPIRMRRRRAA